MPELGEVAHAASLLKRYLLNQVVKSVVASPDELLFVKPLTNTEFGNALTGSTITNVDRNGKYFWFEINHSKTMVLHFGMTGWFHVKDVFTHFIAMENAGDKKQKSLIEKMDKKPTGPVIEDRKSEEWPPKFVKFQLELANGREIVFTDPRRLGRCRLFDVPAKEVMAIAPLSKLGRDFSQNPYTIEEFIPITLKRRVPVKAFLLDQAVFSGVGNWMADEILYQSRIHPEQYCHGLSEDQVKALYEQVLNVSKVSVDTEGNTAAFPETWLMLHRWGKRRKNDPQITPWGQKYEFITVGGRTSCYVPEAQILTGDVISTAKRTTAKKPVPKKTSKLSAANVTAKTKQESDASETSESDFGVKYDSDLSVKSEENDKPPKATKRKRAGTNGYTEDEDELQAEQKFQAKFPAKRSRNNREI